MKFSNNSAGVPNTPTWEKILGMFGFILLCSGFAYFIWVALTERNTPADISFHIAEINALQNGYLVELQIENHGSQSIAAFQFEGHLQSLEGEVETSTAEVDYVPAHSKKYAGLFFNNDPRKGKLIFKSLGYQEP